MTPHETSTALAGYFNDPEAIGVELARALQIVQARLLDDEFDELEQVAKWMNAAYVKTANVVNTTIERSVRE